MADEIGKRDQNSIVTLLGVTNDASAEVRRLKVDPTTGELLVSATGGTLTVKEIDGSPDVSGVDTIRVSNGTLTDDGGGQVTINTGGSTLPVDDTTSIVQDPVDNTKQMRIDVGAVSTATTRVLTMPDADVDLGTVVTASSAFGTDNLMLRSDGTGRGSQASGVSLDDSDNMSGLESLTITTPDTANVSSMTITNNDTTNDTAHITLAGTTNGNFITANTNKFIVNEDGYIGIGVVPTIYPFDVEVNVGSYMRLKTTAAVARVAGFLYQNSTRLYATQISNADAWQVFDFTDVVSRMVIDSSGNAAIGTQTTPTAKFHVRENDTDNIIACRIENNDTTNDTTYLDFSGTSSGTVIDLPSAAVSNIQVGGANAKRTIVLSAAGGWGSTTSGASGPTQVEYTTNDVDLQHFDFDATTDEFVQWTGVMPDSYDGGTLTATFYWTAASGSGDVVWGLAGRAYADSDAIDQAFGTAQTVTDTLITANDVHITSETSAITLAGTPAGGQLIQFRVFRDANAGGDTLGVDARLISVKLEYSIDSYTD